MKIKSLKTWAWVHKWSSLICTAFMLLLCLTGLPLIFAHEIDHLLGNEVEAPEMPKNTPLASMDKLLGNAKALYPSRVPQFVFREIDDDKTWTISLGLTPTSEDDTKFIKLDARTAKVLQEPKFDEGFLHIMFRLHVDLFAGLPGMLFLGLMGVLLVVALISGVVLYAPFMRKLEFGEIRRDRAPKLKRLDTHNFLGVVTLVWALVVGTTGVINAWADLVIKYWQFDQMSAMTAPYKGLQPPKKFGSLQAAVTTAQAREPHMKLGFIAFPGTDFSSPHHYGMFMRGDSPITSRLFKPVLIDAQTSKLTDSREVPWYLAVLLVSQPLHFGDYGGMPLKIIWTILDIFTIVVLWTGLVLWWKKRKQYIPDIESKIRLSEAY
ncbi:MAG TPA: PepSY-associated TM helix domain-containing protein [Methylotenera sp.]|nr:PepSY-associated TM helix domain-containing protein [Methylotenera sp.]